MCFSTPLNWKNSSFRRILLVALTTLLAASPGFAAKGDSKSGNSLATYKLRPMDLIKVQVFQEPDLDRELRVSQDHTIVIPLIGSVNVKDRTVRDTELLITELYGRDYLVNPQVSLSIIEFGKRRFTVLGEVQRPGAYDLPEDQSLNLLQAISPSSALHISTPRFARFRPARFCR